MEQDTQEPISTASVRHPSDIESSRVNELNGTWQSSEVYLPDGSVILFTPGSLLEMEISAPGYVTQFVYNTTLKNAETKFRSTWKKWK